jgi:hypothetical protein
MVTPPPKLFAPAKTKIPAPAFDSEKPAPEIAPLNVTALGFVSAKLDVKDPLPLNVSNPVFVGSPKVTLPPKDTSFVNGRTVAESLESVVPVVMVSKPVPKPALFPTRKMPALNVTPPVKVFAPLSVKVPAPLATNPPPVPLITTL